MGKIADYANVLKSKLTDLFVVYQRNDGELETKNATLEQLGDAICGEQVHADLETNDQTIIGGVNEVKSGLGNKVDGTRPLFKLKTSGNISKTIAGGSFAQILGSDIALTEDGYSPYAICGIYSNQANVCLVAFDSRIVAGSNQFALVRNVSTSQVTATMNVTILFVRDDLD